jgi:hypothetical protein
VVIELVRVVSFVAVLAEPLKCSDLGLQAAAAEPVFTLAAVRRTFAAHAAEAGATAPGAVAAKGFTAPLAARTIVIVEGRIAACA